MGAPRLRDSSHCHLLSIDLGRQVDREDGQRGGHILILDQNVGRYIQVGWGKGPDGFDAIGNEEITHRLGGGGGNGDDAHQHLPLFAKLGQPGNGVDGLPGLHFTVHGLIVSKAAAISRPYSAKPL